MSDVASTVKVKFNFSGPSVNFRLERPDSLSTDVLFFLRRSYATNAEREKKIFAFYLFAYPPPTPLGS